MSTYTQWYNLDKYEGNDKPNLLDQYNTSMEKIDSAMKSLQNQINGGGGTTELEQRIYALECANFNYYKEKNIVFIGDSYTYGTGASDHLSGDTKRFSSRICTWLQANEFNFGVGSTGFIDPGSGGQNSPFVTQVQTASNGMTAAQKQNTRAVIISGGINDANEGTYSYNQMKQAATNVCNAAASAFPNAIIIVVPMLWKGFAFTSTAETYYQAILDGVRASYKATAMSGCYTWNWGDSSRFANDQLHPNDTGHQVIARNVISGLVFRNFVCWEDHNYPMVYASSGNFEGGTNSDNYTMLREGIVYIPPLRVKCLAAVSTNTAFAQLPHALSPISNIYGQCNHGNQIYGTFGITPTALYVNPHITSLAINDDFYITPLSWKVYGAEYNQS